MSMVFAVLCAFGSRHLFLHLQNWLSGFAHYFELFSTAAKRSRCITPIMWIDINDDGCIVSGIFVSRTDSNAVFFSA